VESDWPQGSAVGLVSGTPRSITLIHLPIGDWDVFGNVGIVGVAGTAVDFFVGGHGYSSGALPNSGSFQMLFPTLTIGANPLTLTVPTYRYNLGTATDIYLNVMAVFSSTCTAFGRISARQITT
jgi:hypothetical protein